MSSADDSNIVHVFVGDAGSASDAGKTSGDAVSVDQLSEWLGIIGAVEYIKLQYDATSRRPCFCVRFQRSSDAQQAVERLSGVRLKNCPVTITSRVFKKVVTAETGPGEASAADGSAGSVSDNNSAKLDVLPHNHLLPPDLRMDIELGPSLSQLAAGAEGDGGVAQYQGLLAHQKRLAGLLSRWAEAEKRLDDVTCMIRGGNRTTAIPDGAGDSHGGSSSPSAGLTVVRCTTPVPVSVCGAAALVTHCTARFGPIAWCRCLLDLSNSEDRYYLTMAFMMPQDCESFLGTVSPAADAAPPTQGGKRRRRLEVDATDAASVRAEEALFAAVWEAQPN